MCRLQATVVIEHGSLVRQHTVKQAGMSSIHKRQVGQQIDHYRDQYEKGQTEIDGLDRIVREILHYIFMIDTVCAFAGMCFGIKVFSVATQQMREKQQCQTTSGIDTGPFAGNAKPHADTTQS